MKSRIRGGTEKIMSEIKITDLKEAAPKEIADKVIEVLEDKLAANVQLLEVGKRSSVTDYFVICSATSTTQVKSLSDEVEVKLTECGVAPTRIDGAAGGDWTVLDFNTVIVHVFTKAAREFYKLDKLWADASAVKEGE